MAVYITFTSDTEAVINGKQVYKDVNDNWTSPLPMTTAEVSAFNEAANKRISGSSNVEPLQG